MIEIIKPGTKKNVKCPKCGALLSYDAALDVETEEVPSVIEIISGSNFIKCPQCDNKIIFKQTR